MAGENTDDKVGLPNADDVQQEQKTQEPKELSPIEQKAIEMGWRPQEEFDGDPDDFIDAKEFVRRAPLFEKIEHQSKELKAVRKSLEALKDHYSNVNEAAFDRAMKQLKEQQKQALVESDPDKFYEIEQARENLQKEKEAFVKTQQGLEIKEEVPIHPTLQAWYIRNPWYQNKPHMRVYADQVAQSYAGRMDPEKVLQKIEEAVREEFPNQFRNRNKDAPGAVEDGSSRRGGASKSDNSLAGIEKGLTEDERRVMNRLVRDGHVTKEKYLRLIVTGKQIGRAHV